MDKLIEKAKPIRLLILDVDGVLTSGILYYGKDDFEMKGFNIHDGFGIKLLQKTGVTVAMISGKNSESVARRLQELNIEHVYLGHKDKLPAYEELKQKLKLGDHEIAYIGDDLPDLPILTRVGLTMTVAPSTRYCKTTHRLHYRKKRRQRRGSRSMRTDYAGARQL